MSIIVDLTKSHLAKLASKDVAPAPAPEPKPEEVAPVPELDELTRRSRERAKQLMPHLLYRDEMTAAQYEQKVRQLRRAAQPPPKNPWLDPHGNRRSIWDRD